MIKRIFFIFIFFLFFEKINCLNPIKKSFSIYLLSVPIFYIFLKKILIEEKNSENFFKQKIKILKEKIEHFKNYYNGNSKENLYDEIKVSLDDISNLNFFLLDTIIFDFDSKLFIKKFKVLSLSMVLSLFSPIIFLNKK